MERVLKDTLPNGFGYEWTDLTFQQKTAGNTALIVFPICVMLVFLILSAQYESWGLPLAVILIVPMCLLSAMLGVWLKGSDNNVLTQIGFIVLVGLACKNAILIVEFARERVERGLAPVDAAIEACRLRLRPILMTSFAFIMGVIPLVVAAAGRQRDASGDRHRGIFRHAGRDLVRAVPDAGIFRDYRAVSRPSLAHHPGQASRPRGARNRGDAQCVRHEPRDF